MSFYPQPGGAPLVAYDDGSGSALYAFRGRWTGAAWVPLPPIPGVSSITSITSAAVYDDGTGPGLYFAGGFTGGGFNSIAKWDGHAWSNVGGGVTVSVAGSGPQVGALAVYDDDGLGPRPPGLYAAGTFDQAGSVTAHSVARWNGSVWEPVGGGLIHPLVGPSVFSAMVFSGELYISGFWTTVGGITAHGIARWNGARWADVGGGFPDGVAYAMTPFDDGTGPALFVTGPIINAGGNPVSHIAKWDGSSWSGVGGGLTGGSAGPQGYALAVYDSGSGPGLYVGGNFAAAGGVPANNIARWGPRECPANCDGSTNAAHCPTLNVNDFVCYMGRFAAGDQRANCDGSSLAPVLNVNDFICFQLRFAAGCGS